MDLNQLEMFVAVHEAHSVSKAAVRLFRTQPAVSMALRRLEEEIGCALFLQRNGQSRPVLSPAGEILFPYAKRILRLRSEALSDVNEFRTLHRNRVRIATEECIADCFLPAILEKFQAKDPDVKLDISWQDSRQSIQEVKDGVVDLAFGSLELTDPNIEVVPLIDDEVVLVVGPRHRLRGQKRVRLADIAAENFILLKNDSELEQKVTEAFRQRGISPKVNIELTGFSTIKELIRMNLGVSFLYGMCVKDESAQSGLFRVPIADFKHERRVSMILRGDLDQTAASHRFAKLVQTHLQLAHRRP